MKLIAKWLITAIAVLIASYYVPGIAVASVYTALVVALVLGIVNLVIKPVLFILTLPITILTLGLFAFVLNALMLWLVATLVKGFEVQGFIPALLGSLVIAVISSVGNALLR